LEKFQLEVYDDKLKGWC